MRPATFLFSAALSSVLAIQPNDEIHSLPGWESKFPSRQFSGFVDAIQGGELMHSHYWFVESERSPSSDPLLIWYQGQYRCGLFEEKCTVRPHAAFKMYHLRGFQAVLGPLRSSV